MIKTEWIKERKWGIMTHYLNGVQNRADSCCNTGEVTEWNRCVDEFDVKKYAKTVAEMGAGYVLFTLTQLTKHICAPNATFDRIAGTKPGEACSIRDLPLELAEELEKYDIPLMLYFTCEGPRFDEVIGKKFGFTVKDEEQPLKTTELWASVLEEFAVRYSRKVKGWWIDGCYSWTGNTDEYFKLYKEATLKGNPESIIAFNGGTNVFDCNSKEVDALANYEKTPSKRMKVIIDKAKSGDEKALETFRRRIASHSILDDYTAGEACEFEFLPPKNFADDVQWHILSFLGYPYEFDELWGSGGWACPGSRYCSEYMSDYISKVNKRGGVVTVEVMTRRDGSIDEEQVKTLKNMNLKDVRG